MRNKILTLLVLTLISGCSGFFLGKPNLSEAIDLPKNIKQVKFNIHWDRSISDGTDEKEIKIHPISDGKNVYSVSSDGVLYSHNLETGKKNWKKKVGHNITAGVAGGGDVIVIGSKDGMLLAYSIENADFLWRYQLSSEILASPIFYNGLIIARAIDGQVSALDINTGNLIWRNDVGVASLAIRGNSRPVAVNGIIILTNDRGRMIVLRAETGQQIFDSPVVIGRGRTKVDRIVDLLATPYISGSTLYVSSYRNKTLAINLENGSLLWDSELYTSKDIFADSKYVYLIDKNSIINAVDKNTGKLVWSNKELEGRKISPISGDDEFILTVDYDAKLVVLDRDDGKILAYKDVGSEESYIAPLYINGEWLTFTSDGELTKLSLERK